MSKKHPGLSNEPQPVFVGSCFTLLAFLMQIYLIIISKNGKLIALFNNPVLLTRMMISGAEGDFFTSASWLIMTGTPLLMFVFALIFGKKRAGLLCIPSCLPMTVLVMVFIFTKFISYHIIYVAYFAVGLLHISLAIGLIKTEKPLCIAAVAFIITGLALTLFKMPPFCLPDRGVYLSEFIYFISYNFAVFNFARAVPMQRKAKSEAE